MKKPYLIALDLDGTLLNDDKEITDRTKKVIKQAIKEGHKVVISTGRPYRASKTYYKELGLDTPIINFNGAFIHHPLDPSWGVYHTPLDIETARSVIRTCEAFQLKNIIAEVVDTVYIQNRVEETVNAFSMGEPEVHTGNLHDILVDSPTSILIHPFSEDVDLMRSALEKYHAEVIEHRVWAAPWHIIEIVRKGLSKAEGLKRVSKYYHIPQERIIAFGDEDNDLEMIDYAGQGIAMGNAIDELKNIAYAVTKSNEENGIAIYLEDALSLKGQHT